MILSNFIAGIEILRPHYAESDGYVIGAEHDVFYMYQTDTPLSEEEVAKMRELGWHQEGVDEDDDGNQGPYDPEEGWAAYT